MFEIRPEIRLEWDLNLAPPPPKKRIKHKHQKGLCKRKEIPMRGIALNLGRQKDKRSKIY